MTKDEMRFIRREIINHYLHVNRIRWEQNTGMLNIRWAVRIKEIRRYGFELKAYAND
jgi:hypothetical protein